MISLTFPRTCKVAGRDVSGVLPQWHRLGGTQDPPPRGYLIGEDETQHANRQLEEEDDGQAGGELWARERGVMAAGRGERTAAAVPDTHRLQQADVLPQGAHAAAEGDEEGEDADRDEQHRGVHRHAGHRRLCRGQRHRQPPPGSRSPLGPGTGH